MNLFKFSMLGLLLLMTFAVASASVKEKAEFTKRVKRDFPISMDGEVELFNKYGNVNIKTWNKPEVAIDILITVKAKDQARANEIFERIDFAFSNSANYVSAKTEIQPAKKRIWGWNSNSDDYKIDYTVSMPASNTLGVENKYGDVFIPTMAADVDLSVKYGNFRLEGTGAEANIELGYGNGTVMRSGHVSGDVKYSKFRVKQCEKLDVTTKYSKVTLEELQEARINSKYDTYTIGRVQTLTCEGKYDNYSVDLVEIIQAYAQYSDYKIEDLATAADFQMKYGDVNIGNVQPDFSKIDLDGQYTSFKLDVASGTSFSLDAVGEYAGVKYPENMNVTYEKEKGSYHEVKGSTGSDARVITANLKYGGLKIY